MVRNGEDGDRLCLSRPRTASPSLISLAIAASVFILVYWSKDFSTTIAIDHGPLANDCTLFASASARDEGSGTSRTSPLPFSRAAALTRPGSVLCLISGTYFLSSSFTPTTSGKPSSWIVYKSYGDGPVNFVWTGAADAESMFKVGNGSFPSNPAYLEFRGFDLDGRGNAADGFFCRGSHHLRFINNSISNTGGSGIAAIACDYLTADHNLISHNGYIPSSTSVPQYYSWTSAVSFNSNQWFDAYSGFHNIITNNIIAGEVDQSSHHSDGNGIILDLSNGSYTPSTANTPAALILNNVVYGNGGRCIMAFVVTNFWIVNNTCFKNNLDPKLGNAGAIAASDAHDGYVINNIAVSPQAGHPPYEQVNSNSRIFYYSNLYFGASNNFSYAEPSQLVQADPLFLNPPIFDAAAAEQYATALAPSRLGDALKLKSSSPAISKGIDPSTLPGPLVSELKKYIYLDIRGHARPRGGPFDLGAYQSGHLP